MSILYDVIYFIVMSFFVIPGFTLLFQGIDRKLVARMQNRVGPPILQPFYDFLKLLGKDSRGPNTPYSIFRHAPALFWASVVLLSLYIPFGIPAPFQGYGDIILVIFLFVVVTFFEVIGPMASQSPFALVGAQRRLVVAGSIEPPMALVLISIAYMAAGYSYSHPFSIQSMGLATKHIWSSGNLIAILGWILCLIVMILWLAAEAGKGFFDVSEAETELGGGLDVEYSGTSLAVYRFAHGMATVLGASLISAIFFPWGLSEFFGLTGLVGMTVDVLFNMLKVFIILMFAYTFLRAASGRLKIDQVSGFYWKYVLPIAFLGSFFTIVSFVGGVA